MKHLQIRQVQTTQARLPTGPCPSNGAAWGTDAFHAAMLADIPLFSGLDAVQRRLLAGAMRVKVFQANEAILTQGATSGALFVLQKGHALLCRTDPQGREFILADVQEGDHFGEMSLVDGLPHSAGVRATQRCIVLMLSEADFARCLVGNQGFCMEVLQGLSRHLRRANATIRSLALENVRSRIVQKLVEQAEQVEGRWVIPRRLSRTELAKRVGASREMVSRILTELQDSGWLETGSDGRLVLNLVN